MFAGGSVDFLIEATIVLAMFLLVAFPIHEFAHAFAAFKLGDGTARLMGRLTIDPRAHFDPTGALLLAISLYAFGGGIGWAKPTPYNPMNLRGGRWGEAIVSAAGPISNLILALAAAIPLRYMIATDMAADVPLLFGTLYLFVQINLLLMVFNLIPIPPLDGSKVLFAFLDPRTAYRVRPVLEQYGLIILFGAMLLPIFGGQTLIGIVFGEIFAPLIRFIVGA
jgi:Zn-dependent protease